MKSGTLFARKFSVRKCKTFDIFIDKQPNYEMRVIRVVIDDKTGETRLMFQKNVVFDYPTTVLFEPP